MTRLHSQAQAVLDRYRELAALAHDNPLETLPKAAPATVEEATPGDDGAEVESRECDIPVGGTAIRARVYRPRGGPLPGLVYYHGGGFVMASNEAQESLCRQLAAAIGCVVVSVDYRLAPEHPFPTPVDDCYAALSWVHDQAEALSIDPERLAVAGESAGANLATVVARRAAERGGPQLTYQVLYCPVTDLSRLDTPSYREFGEGYLLTRAGMADLRDSYLADEAEPTDPSVSPLLAPNLTGLPPTYIVAAECDPLRDEANAYARALEAAGVPTRFECYRGQLHAFVGMHEEIGVARTVIARTAAVIRPAYGLPVGRESCGF